jgi:hypothetical protein
MFKVAFRYGDCGHSERQIMPTDLDPVSARKRAAQAQGQADVTILLLFVIFTLVVMLLLMVLY